VDDRRQHFERVGLDRGDAVLDEDVDEAEGRDAERLERRRRVVILLFGLLDIGLVVLSVLQSDPRDHRVLRTPEPLQGASAPLLWRHVGSSVADCNGLFWSGHRQHQQIGGRRGL